MGKILDYDEMNDILDSLNKNVIKKEKPIGYTYFGYPINHYVYGHGQYHVIITGGTHSAELISNVFVIRFMEKLSKREVEVTKIRNLGKKSLKEVLDKVAEMGLKFRD